MNVVRSKERWETIKQSEKLHGNYLLRVEQHRIIIELYVFVWRGKERKKLVEEMPPRLRNNPWIFRKKYISSLWKLKGLFRKMFYGQIISSAMLTSIFSKHTHALHWSMECQAPNSHPFWKFIVLMMTNGLVRIWPPHSWSQVYHSGKIFFCLVFILAIRSEHKIGVKRATIPSVLVVLPDWISALNGGLCKVLQFH